MNCLSNKSYILVRCVTIFFSLLLTMSLFSVDEERVLSYDTDRYVNGSDMLVMLNEKHLSLVIKNNDEIRTFNKTGVHDLVKILDTDPSLLQGAIVADKLIGKAAASLMIMGGVKEVHTNLICTPAVHMFKEADIPVSYAEEVPMIMNRDKSGQCPIDSKIDTVSDSRRCADIIINWSHSLNKVNK